MNRTAVLFMILIALFLLIACRKPGTAQQETDAVSQSVSDARVMEATVLEVNEKTILVEPAEGAWERSSADKIYVSLSDVGDEESLAYLETAAVGDKVQITYNGEVLETYPAQIPKAYSIQKVD